MQNIYNTVSNRGQSLTCIDGLSCPAPNGAKLLLKLLPAKDSVGRYGLIAITRKLNLNYSVSR